MTTNPHLRVTRFRQEPPVSIRVHDQQEVRSNLRRRQVLRVSDKVSDVQIEAVISFGHRVSPFGRRIYG